MNVAILAGGFGTRISEESHLKPKPMIEIGGKPILWHIMKYYSSFGYNDFVICAGYKQNIIKEWFADYYINNCDVTFDFSDDNKLIVHNNLSEPWKVTIVDTGLNTMTGGRLKRIRKYLDDDLFLMTYGDGVADVNLDELIKFHKEHKKLATMTAIRPESRFGVLDIEDGMVKAFREKSQEDAGWINGGFMVLDPKVLDYVKDDTIMFEREPMEKLASEGQLMCYKHYGFWQCMDTMRDRDKLENLLAKGIAPWKKW